MTPRHESGPWAVIWAHRHGDAVANRSQRMSERDVRPIDRCVIGGSVIVALALVVGSIVRVDNAALYFSALGTLGTLDVLYFLFGR